MIVVSTDKGNLSFQSVDDVLKFVQTSAQENIELWISGKQPYPCISLCVLAENMQLSIIFKMIQVICGCLIMRKIKKMLLLWLLEKNGNQMSMQSSVQTVHFLALVNFVLLMNDLVVFSGKSYNFLFIKHTRTIFSASRRTIRWKIFCRPPRKPPVQTATRSKQLWCLSVSGSN